MSFETYDIYFSGKLIKGHDAEDVQKKIGMMFKLQGPKLDQLFSGQPMPIKRGVDMDQAVKYRVAFRDAGALIEIRPVETPRQPPTSASEQIKQPDTEEPLTLSPPNSFDLSDCATPVVPQVIPDITKLELEKPGVILDEHRPHAPLEIDTDALQLDKPGVTLDPSQPQPPSVIDTHDLELNPANQGSLEEFQQQVDPVALPNIDHLKFTEPDNKPRVKTDSKASED